MKMELAAEQEVAGPEWLKSMGFTPVKDCDGWRKRFFSSHIGKMVTVIVPGSSTRIQVTRELERFCPTK